MAPLFLFFHRFEILYVHCKLLYFCITLYPSASNGAEHSEQLAIESSALFIMGLAAQKVSTTYKPMSGQIDLGCTAHKDTCLTGNSEAISMKWHVVP